MRESAIQLIADERARQVTQEGFSPEHDDKHTKGEIAAAAACYALPRLVRSMTLPLGNTVWGFLWPWEHKWWKPGSDSKPADRKRQLVKAAALIVAEIERIEREEREEFKSLTDRAGVTVVDEKIPLQPFDGGTIDRVSGIVRFETPRNEGEAARFTAAAFNDPWLAYEKFFKSDRLVSEFHRATAEQIEDANHESEMNALDNQMRQE